MSLSATSGEASEKSTGRRRQISSGAADEVVWMHPCYQRQFQIPYNSSVYSANVPVDSRAMHRPRRPQGQGNADRRHGVDLRQLCVHDLRIRWRLRARSSPRCPPRCLRFPTANIQGLHLAVLHAKPSPVQHGTRTWMHTIPPAHLLHSTPCVFRVC
jgi:hypothetical protein